MRLWELEEGDGNDVGIGYAGGGHNDHLVEIPDVEIVDDGANGLIGNDEPIEVQLPPQPAAEPPPQGPREQFQREAPLVLRINQLPPQPLPPPPAVVIEPIRRHNHHRRQRPNNVVAREPGNNVRREPGGRAARQRQNDPVRRQGHVEQVQNPVDQEAAQQAWVQMFVRAALNDEEDQVEWDEEEEDAAAWEIPVR